MGDILKALKKKFAGNEAEQAASGMSISDVAPTLKLHEDAATPLASLDLDPSDNARHPLPKPPFDLQGRHLFHVVECLAEGGFGAVYRAQVEPHDGSPADLPATVAIKIFKSGPGLKVTRMFNREVAALLALRHDRIPRVYDHCATGDLPFVAFDFYTRGSLYDELERVGAFPESRALRLMEDLLAALVEAHRACLLHLDIKPANVMLDDHGGFVLADFGISQGHFVSRAAVETGLGTRCFQAPEQRNYAHDSFDARTDLWGVGVTVWAACAGMPGAELSDLRVDDSSEACGYPPISTRVPNISPAFEQLLMPLLANDQARRPSSAADVLASVRALATNQPDAQRQREFARVPAHEAGYLLESVADPMWQHVLQEKGYEHRMVRFQPGELLCARGDESYHAFVLVRGAVAVERDGKEVAREHREGAFLGELTTLAGRTRTADLRAVGQVEALLFEAAEFEAFVSRHPGIAIRLLKTMADRLSRLLTN